MESGVRILGDTAVRVMVTRMSETSVQALDRPDETLVLRSRGTILEVYSQGPGSGARPFVEPVLPFGLCDRLLFGDPVVLRVDRAPLTTRGKEFVEAFGEEASAPRRPLHGEDAVPDDDDYDPDPDLEEPDLAEPPEFEESDPESDHGSAEEESGSEPESDSEEESETGSEFSESDPETDAKETAVRGKRERVASDVSG